MDSIHGACGDTYVLVMTGHLTYQPVHASAPRACFGNLGSAATIARTRLLPSQLGDLHAVLSRWHFILLSLLRCLLRLTSHTQKADTRISSRTASVT